MRPKSLYLAVLAVSLGVAMLPVLWPQLDIATAHFFLQPDPPLPAAQWIWVEWVNEYTPNTFRVLSLACLALWAGVSLLPRLRGWGLALGFNGLALLLGPGFATWLVKEHHLRARPFDTVEFGGDRLFTPAMMQASQCIDNCAFTSGHAACGFFFASLMLMDPHRRWWWIGLGVVLGLSIGLARISVGAHWLSDVLWALPITLLTSWGIWEILCKVYKPTTP